MVAEMLRPALCQRAFSEVAFLLQRLRGGNGQALHPTARGHPHPECQLSGFKRVLSWRAESYATQMPGFLLMFTRLDLVFCGAGVYGECPHGFYEKAR